MRSFSASRLVPLALALVLPIRMAEAHPRLVSAEPAVESRLPKLPRSLILTFSEPLTVALCELAVFDQTQQRVRLDTLRSAPDDRRTIRAAIIGPLAPGRYTVKWQVAGADGHPVRGEYVFHLDTDSAETESSAQEPVPGDTEPPETGFGVASPTYVAIRTVQSVAIVMWLGILAMQLVVLPRYARLAPDGAMLTETAGRAAVGWMAAAVWTVGATTVARLVAQYVAVFGTTEVWSRANTGALLLHSGWGRAWWLALAATLVGLWAVRQVRRERTQGWLALTAAVLTLVVTLAMSSHAAAAPLPSTAIAIHVLHVLGAGGWMGSLAAMMVIAVPAALRADEAARHQTIAALVRAFSPTALAFAGMLAVTGGIAAWRNVGTLDALWQSAYGQVLLVKLATLSVAAATGAYNWKRVLPILGAEPATARLQRSAMVELTAGLAVFVITAVLVATPMPAEVVAVR